jgi:hypothetical protein
MNLVRLGRYWATSALLACVAFPVRANAEDQPSSVTEVGGALDPAHVPAVDPEVTAPADGGDEPTGAIGTPTSPPVKKATSSEDDTETPSKSPIKHEPGRYVQFRADDKSKYRLRIAIQPLFRYTHVSTVKDDGIDMIVRRARFGIDARLPHHTRLKFEIQIKNMHFGLSNMYGSWKPNSHTEIYAGFIKAPGGLERDTYSFDEPFIERSFVAFFTYDHEVGVKVDGDIPGSPIFYALSLTRNAPAAVDGGDPEDMPTYPPGVEVDDIIRAPSKWNTNGRLGVASEKRFEASISWAARFRTESEEPDFGDRLAEPYDSGVTNPRPYTGVMLHGKGDAALSLSHFRVMAEGGVRRDGRQLQIDPTSGARTTLDGHQLAALAYLTFGFTPNGHYGPAYANAPLLDGWEIISRVEGGRIKPVDIGAVRFIAVTSGVHWEVTRQLRLQADFGYQRYNHNAELNNRGAVRLIGQLWATWRI